MKKTGIPLGKTVRIKDGKLERVHVVRSVSDRIRKSKSTKVRVVRKGS